MKKIFTTGIIFIALFSFLVFGENISKVIFKVAKKSIEPKVVAKNEPLTKPKTVTNSSFTYKATREMGEIGTSEESPVDNPNDNLFHVNIDKSFEGNENVVLEFDLYGVESYQSIPFSINSGLAQGGYLVKENSEWNSQSVEIPATELIKGDNIIRFSVHENARYSYKVKNIRIKAKANENKSAKLIINNSTDGTYYGEMAYFNGFVQGGKAKIYVDGQEIAQRNGQFEHLSQEQKDENGSGNWTILVEAVFENGQKISKELKFNHKENCDQQFEMPTGVFEKKMSALKTEAFSISLQGAKLEGGKEALAENTVLSVMALRAADMPALAPDMVNVTANFSGYRFLPHGTNFKKEVNLSLDYDSTKIPTGYTANDIRTFYFDENAHAWVALPLDTVDKENKTVRSTTTHFTDMINGIIQVPESPQTMGYTPTTMSGIKAANPTAGIVQIDPPSANSFGSANLSFPIKIPAGRKGMQPSLGISYNSGGGNGWLGLGWDLSVPSIGIETRWGVPHYDDELESETYTMGGEQLYPVAHRDAWKPREADKQFYPRVEGGFAKIIRKGNKPEEYYWEVTDKGGTKYYYGGNESGLETGAILTDYEGNVAHWALTKVIDLHGNYVSYEYDVDEIKKDENDAYPLRQIYLKKITYTGFGEEKGAYSVEFERDDLVGDDTRKDKSFDARLAFKRYNSDLLKTIKVSYRDTLIRSYELKYKEGAFAKTLLDSITEYDSDGSKFYGHGFEYYDDVKVEDEKMSLFSGEEEWKTVPSGTSDSYNFSFPREAEGYVSTPSALSGSNSWNVGGGAYLGLGAGTDFFSKSRTAGGSYNYNQSRSNGKVLMIDVNGDGLPDKLMYSDKVYYRPQLKAPVNGSKFGDKVEINGINKFLHERSETHTFGIHAYFGVSGSIGDSKTETKTKIYISDVNADGFPDVVENGRVKFNYLDNGIPKFTPDIDKTESEINLGGSISPELFQFDEDEFNEIQNANPLHDVVRIWIAPFDGEINIGAPIKLVESQDDERGSYQTADGIIYTIQHNSNELKRDSIAADDYNQKSCAITKLKVNKYDKIFFRLNSKEDGAYDQVIWNPEIEYQGINPNEFDANNLKVYRFKASEDFLPSARQVITTPISGKIKIEGTFSKPKTTDHVLVQILKSDQVLWQQEYPDSVEVNEQILKEYTVAKDEDISFNLISSTDIDWGKVNWIPRIYYVESFDEDITEVVDDKGNPTIDKYAVAYKSVYPEMIQKPEIFIAPDTANYTIRPLMDIDNCSSDSIWFSVKKKGVLISKKYVDIRNGRIAHPDSSEVSIDLLQGDTVFVSFYIHKRDLNWSINACEYYVRGQGDNLKAGLFSAVHEKSNIYGNLYRNWGQFAYNSNDGRKEQPIDLNLLTVDEEMQEPNSGDYDGMNTDDDLNNTDTYQLNKGTFIIMIPDTKKNKWKGYDNLTYISIDTVSSSRMGQDDVVQFNPFTNSGGGIRAIEKKSKSTGISISGNISSDKLPVSIGANGSFHKNTVLSDFVDMNGDRYPDIIEKGKIQYTYPDGSLSDLTENLHGTYHKTESQSFGMSMGGKLSKSVEIPFGKSTYSVNGNYSAGGGGGSNETLNTYTDINGDGLPDRVYDNNQVEINLGYSFTEKMTWSVGNINTGSSVTANAGLGASTYFNKKNTSFEGGVGLSYSDNEVGESLLDVNGDGLSDKVYKDGEGIHVKINNGTSFMDDFIISDVHNFSKTSTTGASGDITFTVGFPIFLGLKMVISPTINGGFSMSRSNLQISDIDGDGFPDFLKSDFDSDIKVQSSAIARTNKLKTVHRPLKATFTLDYTPVGNTTELGYAVWALSSVETNDNHEGDGVDRMKMEFEYENGYHDRHERAFYGFGTVKTKQLDTEKDDEVYRTTVSNYENQNYYKKGLLLSQYLVDKDNKKYTESINTIKLKKPYKGQNDPEFLDDDFDSDAGIAFPVMVKEEKLFYEGTGTAQKSTYSTYAYDQYGNPTNFTDYGEPDTDEDNISSTVTYDYNPDINLLAMPTSVIIKNNKDIVLRKREAVFNTSNGNIDFIKQYLENGDPAVVDMEYDDYGNMTKITYPKNQNAERMFYEYQYDNIVNSFVERITDAFGYSSTAQYDFKHGQVLKTTDLNGIDLEYSIDNKGRLIHVLGPNEKAEGLPWTIQFEYHPFADKAWAHTKHYDPAYPDDYMETAIFVDGMGRVLQTKKDATVYNKDSKTDEEVMVVTGLVEYDAFGRTVASYLPITEPVGSPGIFNEGVDYIQPTKQTYDVMDRALEVTLPDNAKTKTEYGFADDINGDLQFHVKSTDANGISTESFTNIRGQQTSIKAAMDTWTKFIYDPLGQLKEVTDPIGAVTKSQYDMFGRRTLREHPDAGITTYEYDLAGNMTRMATANLKPSQQHITYKYEYNRLTDIIYPENKVNNVRYEYGAPGAEFNRAGRLVLQEDATGAQEFKYGIMGEITEHERTIVLPGEDIYTFQTKYKFDTWNRMTEMTYPDDEVVKFNYNMGGTLVGMHGEKGGFVYNYITHQGYDKFGRPVHIAYGNGTESTYEYDTERQWLHNLGTKTALGRNILDNVFSYDKVGNILGIKNNSPIPSSDLQGGSSDYTYQYDSLYRLKHAEGSWFGSNHEHKFSLDMEYNAAGDILRKNQLHQRRGTEDGSLSGVEGWTPQHKTTHYFTYKYEGKQPHTLTNIYNSVGPNKGGKTYNYDANGNTTGYTDDQNSNERMMKWDEENRLSALADNGKVHHYIYDAGGNRTIKAKGDNQLVNINGVNTGGKGTADNYTMYVYPHFTVHNHKYTKHFFVGSQRILSKLGQPGTLDDIAEIQKVHGNGNIDYGTKQNNTNEHIQGHIKWVGEDGKVMTAGKSGKIPPGILKKYTDIPEDSVPTGQPDKYERNQYFFHPDHLGNTSFVTDASGEVSQHTEYLPFGEIMVDDRPVNDKNPYLYNGKELDEETGLYYYGARYYDAQVGRFLKVDPIAEEITHLSPYNYASNNPSSKVDLWGLQGVYTWFFNLVDFFGYNNFHQTIVRTPQQHQQFNNRRKGLDVVKKKAEKVWEGQKEAYSYIPGGNIITSALENSSGRLSDEEFAQNIGKEVATELAGGFIFSKIFKLAKGIKVDLMGGQIGAPGYVNYDLQAISGIADDVANFGKHFKPNTVSEIVVDNPMASFLEHITTSMKSGGKITVRGQFKNPNFSGIWDLDEIPGYKILNRKRGIPSDGYTKTDGSPIIGLMNEIVLEKL